MQPLSLVRNRVTTNSALVLQHVLDGLLAHPCGTQRRNIVRTNGTWSERHLLEKNRASTAASRGLALCASCPAQPGRPPLEIPSTQLRHECRFNTGIGSCWRRMQQTTHARRWSSPIYFSRSRLYCRSWLNQIRAFSPSSVVCTTELQCIRELFLAIKLRPFWHSQTRPDQERGKKWPPKK